MVATINALSGNYVMWGRDQPLIVRFMDPKKPRIGESRGHVAFGGPKVWSPLSRATRWACT